MYLKFKRFYSDISNIKAPPQGLAGAGSAEVKAVEEGFGGMQMRLVFALFVVLAGAVSMATVSGEARAAEIKKCQDAEGNWHYGSFAAASCADANVDEIDSTGTKTGVDKPPPSSEEIERQEKLAAAVEQAKKDKKAQRDHDLEVLRIYGTEQTIISTRDRKLAAIDKNIEVTRQIKEGTLKDIAKLNKLKKSRKTTRLLKEREDAVKSYNRVIRHNLTAREELSEKYISILSEFREAYGRVYTQ